MLLPVLTTTTQFHQRLQSLLYQQLHCIALLELITGCTPPPSAHM